MFKKVFDGLNADDDGIVHQKEFLRFLSAAEEEKDRKKVGKGARWVTNMLISLEAAQMAQYT